MKLIGCHVNNYGKLHEQDFSFQDGLNIIHEENGYGKSTLMSFIKAMFYGLEGRMSDSSSERSRYNPWQGGVYGGSLIFENDGQQYRIERTFGAKESEDKAELSNLQSGKRENAANMGARLFGLDSAAFTRTTYVPHKTEDTENFEGMNAKIHALLESGADAEQYNSAIKRLGAQSDLLTRKGGQIAETETRLKRCEQQLERARTEEQRILEHETRLAEIQDTIAEVKAALTSQEKRQADRKELERAKGVLDNYEKFSRRKKTKQQQLESLEQYFSGYKPTANELKEQKEKLDSAANLEKEMEQVRENIKAIHTVAPKKPEEPAREPFFARVSALQKQISAQKEVAATAAASMAPNGTPSQSPFHNNSSQKPISSEKKPSLGGQNEPADILPQAQMRGGAVPKQKHSILVPVILSVAVAAIAVILAVLGVVKILPFVVVIGVISGAAAAEIALVIVISLLSRKGGRRGAASGADKNGIADAQTESSYTGASQATQTNIATDSGAVEPSVKTDTAAQECGAVSTERLAEKNLHTEGVAQASVAATVTPINADQERQTNAAENAVNTLESDLLRAEEHATQEYDAAMQKYADALKKYNDRVKEFQEKTAEIKVLQNLLGGLTERRAALVKETDAYVSKFENDGNGTANILADIDNKFYCLDRYRKELDELNAEDERYREEVGYAQAKQTFDRLSETVKGGAEDEIKALNEKLSTLTEEKTSKTALVARYFSEQSPVAALNAERADLQATLTELRQKAEALRGAKSLTEAAKKSLDQKYLPTMQQWFASYSEALTDYETVHLSDSFEITVEEDGQPRKIAAFSTGYQDIFEFCRRVALVDLAFKDNPCFMILDDPFVNLDEERLKSALKTVKQISGQKQIVYFTCHTSRMV